jgi:TonB family protein
MPSKWPDRAFDLLGQAERPRFKARLYPGAGPRLDVPWGGFQQSLWGSILVVFGGTIPPKDFRGGPLFRDCWIERRAPRRAVVAAGLWHIALLILPFPDLPARPRRAAEEPDWQLTWSGPMNDLSPLELPGPKSKPSPRGQPSKPLSPKGADAFHPRQTIFTDPVRPTHPRQTLINPAAPPEPPKFLPNLPNIVQLSATVAPARPRLEISRETLAKLRPHVRRQTRVATDVAAPELPNAELHVSDVNLVPAPNAPARPKLQVNASSAPRLGPREQRGEAAPDVAPSFGASGSSPSTLIALSATPAPPAPSVQVPEGNLSARLSISPEGGRSGVPGGSPNGTPNATGGANGGADSMGGTGSGAGTNGATVPGVSITGGNPGTMSSVSGLGGSGSGRLVGFPRMLPSKPEPRLGSSDGGRSRQATPADFAALRPGAKPEEIFGPKRVYTLHINMPNLNSATGSWILSFTELRDDPTAAPPVGELTGPVPERKVDPKYPPALVSEKIEGEVVLYAVIRKDGSVDSIQLVRGLDEQLDANAINALARWQFRPAERLGSPVELEAVVHIPFRAVAPLY